ncbi:nitroreductase [Altericroceibacterium spongiae]|uniref:Nitroreductase n=1 Tax=Altericroceibacterium spongiae TaxID=2320269 RepID=A0A420ER41_9SPHN|nr:nitroreductase family protein [Altericroceibacterium spongiae]RKF23131.1 nitroreductase [Altericroceibacterium spongiae]
MSNQSPRVATHAINPVFTARWSPRAFDEQPIEETAVLRLIEAARWAPSAYNVQPWQFCYALRGDENWDAFLDILIPFNQSWASSASALIFVISDMYMREANGTPKTESLSHSFDAGAAWGQLALQATFDGLHVHGMTGFDTVKAANVLNISEGYKVEAAIAVGKMGDAATLPDGLRERELPSDRKPLTEIAHHGPLSA